MDSIAHEEVKNPCTIAGVNFTQEGVIAIATYSKVLADMGKSPIWTNHVPPM